MIVRLNVSGHRRAAAAAAVAAAALLAAAIGRQAYVGWCLARPTPARLEKARALDPRNCQLLYRLGLAYAFEIDPPDEARGRQYARQAVGCRPASGEYWMALAETLEAQGAGRDAVAAAERAAAADPRNVHRLWEAGNLLLRNGAAAEAFADFRRVLEGAPEYAEPVFSAGWKAGGGSALLDRVVPDTAAMNLAYLQFLSRRSPPPWPEAARVWNRLLARPERFPAAPVLPYVDALLEAGRGEEAAGVWNRLVELGVLPRAEFRPPDNAVVNGGFEAPPLGDGLDWRIAPVAGASVALDAATHHGGASSLAVRFPGLANVDFAAVSERIPVKPGSRYTLSAFMKSRGLTTGSRPRLEAFDPQDPGRYHWQTPPVAGTAEWSRYEAGLETGPTTRQLVIRLRRAPALGSQNRIEGTWWVDDVRLEPRAR
jgi:tetratricopeptide (TPR) repeat protein